jgi:DNA adenine methylase
MHKHSPPPPRPALPTTSKPFLKWSGWKQRLLSQLLPLLPAGSSLIEPFVGAGSVFLATEYDSYIINDANSDLIAAWVAILQRPREFSERAAAFFTKEHWSQEAYLRIRAEFNAHVDRFERAVRLPYLNKFGFNGLYRVNSRDEFNVPYGRPSSLPRFPVGEVEAAAHKLKRCLVLAGGFEVAISLAEAGDVVYCDPPYLPSSTGGSFTQYTTAGFSMDDHERLVACCDEAVRRGAVVLISNHDTEQTRELYRGWELVPLAVRRSISANSGSRLLAQELVAIKRP